MPNECYTIVSKLYIKQGYFERAKPNLNRVKYNSKARENWKKGRNRKKGIDSKNRKLQYQKKQSF